MGDKDKEREIEQKILDAARSMGRVEKNVENKSVESIDTILDNTIHPMNKAYFRMMKTRGHYPMDNVYDFLGESERKLKNNARSVAKRAVDRARGGEPKESDIEEAMDDEL